MITVVLGAAHDSYRPLQRPQCALPVVNRVDILQSSSIPAEPIISFKRISDLPTATYEFPFNQKSGGRDDSTLLDICSKSTTGCS
jgi:hypothetical protein